MKIILPFAVVAIGIAIVLVLAPSLIQTQQLSFSQAQEQTSQNFLPTPLPQDQFILPDLQLSSIKNLYIQNSGGKKMMHFDTTFSNIGEGPLELYGDNQPENNVTVASQTIQKRDGTSQTQEIGAFVYHPGHDHLHWHTDKYAQFQIFDLNNNLLSQTDKFSFCIWDEHAYDLDIPNAPQTRQYSRCPESNIQGMSVGWGDTYKGQVEGQELDITDIPDGTYVVKSTINVDRKIMESNYSNNTSEAYVTISGNNLEIVQNAGN